MILHHMSYIGTKKVCMNYHQMLSLSEGLEFLIFACERVKMESWILHGLDYSLLSVIKMTAADSVYQGTVFFPLYDMRGGGGGGESFQNRSNLPGV